ncbi:hypothetical protein AB0Y14_02880 [Rothia sp. HC945]|uniref:hypothetical protein n=1 Tax=Rothia sp. HC945 TaxID=3171170 RepID=UPI003F2770BC
MTLLALSAMILAAVLGAIVCFRVPAVSVRARRTWATVFLILLVLAAGTAAASALQGKGAGIEPWGAVLAIVSAVAAAALTGSPVTAAVLQFSQRTGRLYRSGRRPEPSDTAPADPERDSDLHGGLWIGVLERIGVAVTLIAGWPTGLTVLAAIKALGRFAELKEPDAVERFILGTFGSFLWAAAWAGVAMLLTKGL